MLCCSSVLNTNYKMFLVKRESDSRSVSNCIERRIIKNVEGEFNVFNFFNTVLFKVAANESNGIYRMLIWHYFARKEVVYPTALS